MRITTGHGPDPHPPFPGIEHVTFPSASPKKTTEWLKEYLHALIVKEAKDGSSIIILIGATAIEFMANAAPPCAEDNHIGICLDSKEDFDAWDTWLEAVIPKKVIDRGNTPKYITREIPGQVGLQIVHREKSLIRDKVDHKFPHVS